MFNSTCSKSTVFPVTVFHNHLFHPNVFFSKKVFLTCHIQPYLVLLCMTLFPYRYDFSKVNPAERSFSLPSVYILSLFYFLFFHIVFSKLSSLLSLCKSCSIFSLAFPRFSFHVLAVSFPGISGLVSLHSLKPPTLQS